MKTDLVVSFEIDGLHYWPNAPLRYSEFEHPHRHLFKIVCYFPTRESNDVARREEELWELRRKCITKVMETFAFRDCEQCNFEDRSCEGIAQELIHLLKATEVFVGEEYWLGAWARR